MSTRDQGALFLEKFVENAPNNFISNIRNNDHLPRKEIILYLLKFLDDEEKEARQSQNFRSSVYKLLIRFFKAVEEKEKEILEEKMLQYLKSEPNSYLRMLLLETLTK